MMNLIVPPLHVRTRSCPYRCDKTLYSACHMWHYPMLARHGESEIHYEVSVVCERRSHSSRLVWQERKLACQSTRMHGSSIDIIYMRNMDRKRNNTKIVTSVLWTWLKSVNRSSTMSQWMSLWRYTRLWLTLLKWTNSSQTWKSFEIQDLCSLNATFPC